MPQLHIYKSEKETLQSFSAWMAELVKEALHKQEKFTIAFSGGKVSKMLYKSMSLLSVTELSKVEVFAGEEIFASRNDNKNKGAKSSNFFWEELPVSYKQIHFIQKDIAQGDSANKPFDLVILGLDEEENSVLHFDENLETKDTDTGTASAYDTQQNFFSTLSISEINAAAVKVFLLTGKRKDDIVQQVLKGKYNPEKYPAQLVQTANKSVHWFLDEHAAGKLINSIS